MAPLPYAQADLDALQRVNDPGLSAVATASVGDIVDHILDVPSTRGATLLPDGPLTARCGRPAQRQQQHGRRSPPPTGRPRPQTRPGPALPTAVDTAPRRLSPQVVAAPFDPAVGAALAGAGTDPSVADLSGPLADGSARA